MSLLLALSMASAGPLDDVVVKLGEGVQVNWTTLAIEATGSARLPGRTVRPVEELARREVDASLRNALGRVLIHGETRLARLLGNEQLGPALRARSSRWTVYEAVYGTSGRVWLRARLSLHDVLKPWLLERALPRRATHPVAPGVLVDARGLPVTPTFAPRFVGPQGEVVYDGQLDGVAAVVEAPVRYVFDPAHPVAGALGDDALVLFPERVLQRSTLRFDEPSAELLRSHLESLHQRGVVLVVDGG